MLMSVEHERLVRMIKESISLMCKSSLNYELEMNVEGLLGITLDKKDIFLVNINESFQTDAQKEILEREKEEAERAKTPQKRRHDSDIDIKEEEGSTRSPASGAKKRRARRRSRDSQGVAENESIASTSQHSPARVPYADTSRDSAHLGGSMESQSSEDTGVKEESSGLDFGDFVIKQEVGDVDENAEDGEEDDDLYFTGESFEGQPPYPMGMPGPSGSGGGGTGQMMPPGAEGDGSQSGLNATPYHGHGLFPRSLAAVSRMYSCRYCGRQFQTRSGKRFHEKVHTGETFNCTKCQKKFTTNSSLQCHFRAVHQNIKFTCDSCGKVFTYLCDLQKHHKLTLCGRKAKSGHNIE